MDIDAAVLAAFQEEHRDQLEGIRSFLASAGAGSAAPEGLNEAFRLAHSLKGAARVCDLRPVERLGHQLEALFAGVREGVVALDRQAREAIELVLGAVEDWMAALAVGQTPQEPAAALAAIDRVMGFEPPADRAASPPAPPRPPAAGADPPQAADRIDTLRVRADSLDDLLRSADRVIAEGTRQQRIGRELAELGGAIRELEREWESVRTVSAASLHQLATTPQLARIERWLDFVAHAIRRLSRQERAVGRLHRRSAWSLAGLGTSLQREVRRARMVSAGSIYAGFRKMVRDLARDAGREIELDVTGFDVEADRMVLQALKSPLMHMLRNAVAHGIEPPADRRTAGKPPAGRVHLGLESRGNRLRILLEDDGRGVDLPQVAAAARSRGLLPAAGTQEPAPDQIAELIFQPGLTTTSDATDLAGRGVGLTDAWEAARRLQGEVSVRTSAGEGTAFEITVPLTVSTHRLLLVACGGQRYAIPVYGIERLMRVALGDIDSIEGRPVVSFEGRPIELLGLARLLDLGDGELEIEGSSAAVVVIRSGPVPAGVVVEGLLAEQEALITRVGGPAGRHPKLSGAVLVDDGSVVLVLNPATLAEGAQRGAAAVRSAPRVEPRTPTVLVVDDSFTTRTLEKSILETHGYDVRIAVDGLEALLALRSERIDLVITDIQMPRLDGFCLVEEMKKDPDLAAMPVIMVTSLERREDRVRGLTLGADAYIVKRRFDHQELLETIRQLI